MQFVLFNCTKSVTNKQSINQSTIKEQFNLILHNHSWSRFTKVLKQTTYDFLNSKPRNDKFANK